MLGDSVNINSFNCNPVVLKKIAKTSKNYNFLAQLVQKLDPHGPRPKQKAFFSVIAKPDHKLSKTFYFIKISYVLVECFSILCDVFLLKSVIFSITAVSNREWVGELF